MSPPCSFSTSPIERPEHVHVVAQRGVFGRELDVVALHGARRFYSECQRDGAPPPRRESCTYGPGTNSRERQRLGMLFVAGAAILFASKGLFSKALYQRGVGFELLVTVRALLAMPLFAWFALRAKRSWRRPSPPTAEAGARCLAAAIAGIVCYYVGALVDFWALTLIDASIERVLLFSYPALVVLISSFMKRRAPETRVVLAMLVTYAGIFFAMGGIDFTELRAEPVRRHAGADRRTDYRYLLPDRRTLHAGARQHAFRRHRHELIRRDAGDCTSRCSARSTSSRRLRPTTGCCSAYSRSPACSCRGCMQAEGMRRVGAQRAAIGSTIGPPTTILLAALFLGERLNGWQLLGSAMIVGSVLVLSWPKRVVADEP